MFGEAPTPDSKERTFFPSSEMPAMLAQSSHSMDCGGPSGGTTTSS